MIIEMKTKCKGDWENNDPTECESSMNLITHA